MQCELNVTFTNNTQMPDEANRDGTQVVVIVIAQSLRGSHHDALTGVDPERIDVFHVADRDAVVLGIANHLVFDLLPPLQVFLDQNLGGVGERSAGQRGQFLTISCNPGTLATEGIRSPDHHRVRDLLGGDQRILEVLTGETSRSVQIDGSKNLGKEVPILCRTDRLERSAQHLNTMAFQNSLLIQFHPAIERGLSAEGEQQPIWFLSFDDAFDKLHIDRQEVDFIGQVLAGLDCGDVGIDQDRGDPFFLQRLDRLGTRVIKLPCFTDLECSTTENENLSRQDNLSRTAWGQYRISLMVGSSIHRTNSRNLSKSPAASSGPGLASG